MLRSTLPTGEERRDLSLVDAGVKLEPTVVGSGERPRYFEGYSSVFNKRAAIGNPLKGGFLEEIAPGAYTKTITEADQRHLLDHNSFYVVSRRSAGTLEQTQDAFGLLVRSNLDYNLSYVNDMAANVVNGNLTGMSIGFRVPEGRDEWGTAHMETRDGSVEVELRTIREIALLENSTVTFPAYEDTTAALRHSLVPALLQRRDAEAIRRAVSYRPDLADFLGYDADLASTVIDLGRGTYSVKAAREIEGLPGEVLGHDTAIHAVANTMNPSEEREPTNTGTEPGKPSIDAPAETTRHEEGTAVTEAEDSAPAASTRNAPSQRELAKATLRHKKFRKNRLAA